MQNNNQVHRHSKGELSAMAHGQMAGHIDDMEFFETLAKSRCLVMPPWVYHITPQGHLEKVAAVRYTPEYELDKPSMLLAVMERMPQKAERGVAQYS